MYLRARHFGTTALAVILLSGCSSVLMDPSVYKIFQEESVNVTAKSYAAADYLDQQARHFVNHSVLLQAQPLEDAYEPRLTSRVAKLIPEQVGIRLAQLGYRVDLSPVLVSDNPNYLKPAMSAGESPRFILTGTYARRRTDMDVSLRILDSASNRIVSTFDYTMPMDRDIGEMSAPEARIFKTSE